MKIEDKHIKKDIISAVFLLLVGMFAIFESFRISIWKNSVPNEGFFPLILGILLLSLSIALLVINILKNKNIEYPGAMDEKIDKRRLYKYLVAALFYVILLEKLGYILTSGLFFISILKFVEKRSYLISLLITLAVVSLSFFLFNSLLGVPLPPGIINDLWR